MGESGADTLPEVFVFIGDVPADDDSYAQSGDSLQVARGKPVKLSWTSANADTVELTDPANGVSTLAPNNSVFVTPDSEEQDYSLVANGKSSQSAPRTVHVSTHPANGVPVSGHVYVAPAGSIGGHPVQIVVPLNTKLFNGPLINPDLAKFRCIEFELNLTIEAQGTIAVGKGIGLPLPAGSKPIIVQPGGWDDGFKAALATQVQWQLGSSHVTVQDLRLIGVASEDGINIGVEIEGTIYGFSVKLTFSLIKTREKWTKVGILEAELDVGHSFVDVAQLSPNGKFALGPDLAVQELSVAVHIKGVARPNWKKVAEWILEKLSLKVAEEALESAAVDTLTDVAVNTAVSTGGAEAAAEDVTLLAGVEVLVASGALLAAIWIVAKVFQTMEQADWNRAADDKVKELAAAYVEGYRMGIMQEPEPTDERQLLGYRRGNGRFLVAKSKYYAMSQLNMREPGAMLFSKTQIDEQLTELIKSDWIGSSSSVDTSDPDVTVTTYSERGTAEILCKQTAQVTLFSSWAENGHDGATDWPDRGNAFLAVFGYDPHHHDPSDMQPWEKEVWEHFYGPEYSA